MGCWAARPAAAPVKTWGPPEESVVVVDDVLGLKQAVHDEMERIGCGFYQRRVVTIMGLGNISDAVEILAIGYLLTVYADEEGAITPWESSLLTAAVFAGMLCGGLLGGVAGDMYGRKPILLATLATNALASFFSALSPNIYWLILFRALAGVGVGGVVGLLYAVTLEHVPVAARGRYVTILCSFWMLGAILTAATAWIMLGNDIHGKRLLPISWRWFAAVVGLPSFLCSLLTYRYVPESPHFLASQGDAQGASRVLQYIHSVNQSSRHVKIKLATATTDSSDNEDAEDGLRRPSRPSSAEDEDHFRSQAEDRRSGSICSGESLQVVLHLFMKPHAAQTLLLMHCGFCLSFGSYGLTTWITKLFQSVGLANPFANAFLFAGANLPGNLVSLYMVDHVGHQWLLSGAFFTSAICSLLFALNIEGSTTIIVLVSCLFNACTTAAWNGFGVLSAENFPQELRTTGISVVNCSNRVAAICAQFVNGFLMGPPPHLEALLLVVTTVMVCGGLASRFIEHGGEDDIDSISKEEADDSVLPLADNRTLCGLAPLAAVEAAEEHEGLVSHDVLLRGQKRVKGSSKEEVEADSNKVVQRPPKERVSPSA